MIIHSWLNRQQAICSVAIFIRIEKTSAKHGVSTELDDECFAIVRSTTKQYWGFRSGCTRTRDKALAFDCNPFMHASAWKIKPAIMVACCMIGLRIHPRGFYWVAIHINHTPGKVVFWRQWRGNDCCSRHRL